MDINQNIDFLLDEIQINEEQVDPNWAVSHGLAVAGLTGVSTAFLGGAALAVFALVAGAKIFASYINSIGRLKGLIKSYQLKLQKEKDPVKQVSIRTKLAEIQKRLQESQAKARLKKTEFINETRELQKRLNEERIKKNQPAILKLQKELQNRQKVMSKIGAL